MVEELHRTLPHINHTQASRAFRGIGTQKRLKFKAFRPMMHKRVPKRKSAGNLTSLGFMKHEVLEIDGF